MIPGLHKWKVVARPKSANWEPWDKRGRSLWFIAKLTIFALNNPRKIDLFRFPSVIKNPICSKKTCVQKLYAISKWIVQFDRGRHNLSGKTRRNTSKPARSARRGTSTVCQKSATAKQVSFLAVISKVVVRFQCFWFYSAEGGIKSIRKYKSKILKPFRSAWQGNSKGSLIIYQEI